MPDRESCTAKRVTRPNRSDPAAFVPCYSRVLVAEKPEV